MIARINVPGSFDHGWLRGTKSECLAWIGRFKTTDRARCTLLTEKQAAKIRYRDGRKVYPKPSEVPMG